MTSTDFIPDADDIRFAAWIRSLPPTQRKALSKCFRAVANVLQSDDEPSQPKAQPKTDSI